MAKVKTLRAIVKRRRAAQAAQAAKAAKAGTVGAAIKTGLTAAAVTSITRAFNNDDQMLQQSADQAGEAMQLAAEKQIDKPSVSSEIPAATLAFTEYVKNQTESVEPVRALGVPLPELVISKNFSAIIQDIITNINGIKTRLEKVEIKTRKQLTVLLNLKTASMGLNETVRDSIDQERQADLRERRDEDEEDIERKGIGNIANNVFGRIGDFAGRTKDGILAAILPFLLPAALFGTSFALDQVSDFVPEVAPDLDVEDILTVVDTIGEKVAGITAAFTGLGQGRAAGAVVTKIPIISRAGVAVSQVISKVNPGSAVYAKFLPAIQRVQGFFARISKSTSGIVVLAAKLTSGLGAGAAAKFKAFGRGVLKWYLIFEAFQLMVTAVQLLIMGTIDETEFHKRVKAQIAQIVTLLGGPYLLMVLFGFLGTVVPIIGNIAGAIAGFITGIFLGDKVSQILKLETLTDGLYDWFFLGDTTKIKTFPRELIIGLTRELPAMLRQAIAENKITTFVRSSMEDRMATEDEIISKYGADADDLEVLTRATRDIGTDENAVLYAFRNIKSTEDYLNLKNRFETEFLPAHNVRRGLFGKIETMEEYLQKELSRNEYRQLADQIRQQISDNGNIEEAKLSEFFREVIGVDDRPQIRNYGGATQEEYSLFKAGEIVAVTTVTGGRKLMTEEQILTSDEVGIAARKSALERLEQNRKIAESEGLRPSNSQSAVVPMPRQAQPNILIVSPPSMTSRAPMNNLAGTGGPVQFTPAQPSRLIDDSFVDLAYLT